MRLTNVIVAKDIAKILKYGLDNYQTIGNVRHEENGNLQIVYESPSVTYYYTVTDKEYYIGRTGIGDVIIIGDQEIAYDKDPKTNVNSKGYKSFFKLYQVLIEERRKLDHLSSSNSLIVTN